MKTLTFYNNRGDLEKISLVYHLSWMFAELGLTVVIADLDPQSNLTSAFLEEDCLEDLWEENADFPTDGGKAGTIRAAVTPLIEFTGDIRTLNVVPIADRIGLIPGDPGLIGFENPLEESWSRCLSDNQSDSEYAFRISTAFYRIMSAAAQNHGADIVLIDAGPQLGPLNRAAFVASDFVVVPMIADLFSVYGIRNLGPMVCDWRKQWATRLAQSGNLPLFAEMPAGTMLPIGYVVMQPFVQERYPLMVRRRWTHRIPEMYHTKVLNESDGRAIPDPDPQLLATLKNYRSLAPLAQDARKPMFLLNSSDGALGGHIKAVNSCYEDFEKLARSIAKACKLKVKDSASSHLFS